MKIPKHKNMTIEEFNRGYKRRNGPLDRLTSDLGVATKREEVESILESLENERKCIDVLENEVMESRFLDRTQCHDLLYELRIKRLALNIDATNKYSKLSKAS